MKKLINENDIKRKIGDYLKEIRLSKKKTAKEIGSMLEVSQSYVSGIENAQKSLPRIKFIQDYIRAVADNSIEYNKYVDNINKIAEGIFTLEKIENHKETHKNDVQIIGYHDAEGNYSEEYTPVPVNDLLYHLKDLFNNKYYGSYRLSPRELRHIREYIYEYLRTSKVLEMSIIRNQKREYDTKLMQLAMDQKESTEKYKFTKEFIEVLTNKLSSKENELYKIKESYASKEKISDKEE